MRSLLDLPDDLIRPEWRDCLVPGRPWWTPVTDRAGYVDASKPVRVERCDGYRHPDGVAKIDFAGGVDHITEGEQAVAHYDAEHPLPHPGYRPGQIWVVMWGSIAMMLGPLTSGDCARGEEVTDGPLLFTLADVPGWEYTRSCVSLDDAWGPVPLPGGNAPGIFLLYDPLRPDLAPWSSPRPLGQRDPTTA